MLKRTLSLVGSLLLFVPLLSFSAEVAPDNATLMPVPAETSGTSSMADAAVDAPSADALSTRIALLEQENATLKTQLTREQAVAGNLSRMIQMQAQQARMPSTLLGYVQNLRDRLGETGFNVAVGSIILALLIFAVLLWPRQQLQAKPEPPQKVNDDDEYDYLGSEEGIPAKLDLARAYIDMDDKTSAKSVLIEISQQGNDEQKHEASMMLEGLAS